MTPVLLKQHGMEENGLIGQTDFVFLSNLEAAVMEFLNPVILVVQHVKIAMVNTPLLSSLAKTVPLVPDLLFVR